MVTPAVVLATVREPAAVLQQANGNFLHLGERGAVVLNSSGEMVTAWARSDFNFANELSLRDALGAK